MKIKIVQNGMFIYAIREEDIFNNGFYNLIMIKTGYDRDFDDPLNNAAIKYLLGFKVYREERFNRLENDVVRNPTIEEYIYLSRLFKSHGFKYNKRKDIPIILEK